jgi:hypothetical protein
LAAISARLSGRILPVDIRQIKGVFTSLRAVGNEIPGILRLCFPSYIPPNPIILFDNPGLLRGNPIKSVRKRGLLLKKLILFARKPAFPKNSKNQRNILIPFGQ